MKSLATNSLLAIVTVAAVLLMIMAHEVLAAISIDRFVLAKRWLVVGFTVLGLLLTVLIASRFYYLRAA
jgi:F0F1-type ATP synthase assembly protein I